jgi:hypothetical protein
LKQRAGSWRLERSQRQKSSFARDERVYGRKLLHKQIPAALGKNSRDIPTWLTVYRDHLIRLLVMAQAYNQ